jgi:hypothetical protein
MDAVANLMHLGPFAFEYFKGRTTAVPASIPALATGYHFFPRFVLVIICHCQAGFPPSAALKAHRRLPNSLRSTADMSRPQPWPETCGMYGESQ